MPRQPIVLPAVAAASLAAAPAFGTAAPPGLWMSFCTQDGASMRLVPDDRNPPRKRDVAGCHAAGTIPRKLAGRTDRAPA